MSKLITLYDTVCNFILRDKSETKNGELHPSSNEISNALMNAYDIKKNSYFKKIKDNILDEEIGDPSDYTVGDCMDDIINSLEQVEVE